MAKAILVLDEMYKTCSECRLEFYSDVLGVQCAAEHRTICEMWEGIDQKGKPDWCPLKEPPDKSAKDKLIKIEDRLIDLIGQADHVSNGLDALVGDISDFEEKMEDL